MNKNLLKETTACHRDGEMQMNIYEMQYDVPYHWHDEYEFIYAAKGVCNCVIEGNQIALQEGELLLIQGGELHTVNTNVDADFYAVVVHPYLCGVECYKFFSASMKFHRVFSRQNEAEAKIIDKVTEVYRIFKGKSYTRELKIKSLVCDIFCTIYENKLFRETDLIGKEYYIFEKLIAYIHENYVSKISLEQLCEIVNYSKPFVINLFKKHTGKTPIDYINRYRIYKVQELLLSENKNVIDIALENGFDNIGYFNRLFKHYLGMTPSKWRRKNT